MTTVYADISIAETRVQSRLATFNTAHLVTECSFSGVKGKQ